MEGGPLHPGRSGIPPARRKAGLETPLEGRFSKENRRLVFAPPRWYDLLVLACLFGWPLLIVFAPPHLHDSAWIAAPLVFFAGIWGAVSNERMICDLAARTYARLEGQNLGKRVTRGSLDEMDAIVLVAENLPVQHLRPAVVYRLVLHFKGQVRPPLVIGRLEVALPQGARLGFGVEGMQALGLRYASALGVKFFDNSHFPSASPVPVV